MGLRAVGLVTATRHGTVASDNTRRTGPPRWSGYATWRKGESRRNEAYACGRSPVARVRLVFIKLFETPYASKSFGCRCPRPSGVGWPPVESPFGGRLVQNLTIIERTRTPKGACAICLGQPTDTGCAISTSGLETPDELAFARHSIKRHQIAIAFAREEAGHVDDPYSSGLKA